MDIAINLLIVIGLIAVNGYFSMSEMAIVSARRVRLEQLAEAGNRGARVAIALADDPTRFLSTVQIGITLVGIIAGAFGGATLSDPLARLLARIPALAPYSYAVAFAAVVALITYLSLIIGELVPKRVALGNPEGVASAVARPMRALSRATAPLVWLLGASTQGLLRLFGLREERDAGVTEEEVRSLIAEGAKSGVFEPAEHEMIEGVFRLADRPVRAIMTPRQEVFWLEPSDDLAAIRREINDSGHSRFPLCRGSLDDLVGIVEARDLLDRMLAGEALDLQAAARDALVVHDGTTVLRLLDLFKSSPQRLAVIVDEYGSVEGVVSTTDILEAIAGALPDAGEAADSGAVRRDDGSWLLDGMMPVDEVEARISLKGLRGGGDFHTLAGFVLWQIGHLPSAGEHFDWQGWRFEVVDMDGRRIDKVLAVPPPTDAAETTAET